MNDIFSKKFWIGGTARRIIHGGLLAAVTVAASGIAFAQDTDQDKKDEFTFSLLPNATTSTALTPQQGNSEFLATHGVGTQGYVCLPSGLGASWTVNNARPEATLFTNAFGSAFQNTLTTSARDPSLALSPSTRISLVQTVQQALRNPIETALH